MKKIAEILLLYCRDLAAMYNVLDYKGVKSRVLATSWTYLFSKPFVSLTEHREHR